MPKQIELVSNQVVLVDAASALDVANELRKEHGDGKSGKKSLTMEQLVATTKVIEERTDEFGMIQLNLDYEDEQKCPCTQNFPGYALGIVSKSALTIAGPNLEIQINVIVSAEKKKRQLDEIASFVKILSDNNTRLNLCYFADETTDRAGYSMPLKITNGLVDSFGFGYLPMSFFKVSFK